MKIRDFLILLTIIFLSPSPSSAQDIYKWVGEDGAVHYSTTRRGKLQSPVALPKITRENIDRRIKSIRASIPANCFNHGGVDCSKGADVDGTVICLDGFKGAVLPFRFHCMETKLEGDLQVLFKGADSPLRIADDKSVMTNEGKAPELLILAMRNLTGTEAQGVKVNFVLPQNKSQAAKGPDVIPPYGVADYTLPLSVDMGHIDPKKLKDLKFEVACVNCASVSAIGY